MAKKTKNSNLSIEERLEQALIPNRDEPYKLPPNWCWTKLSSISAFERGITFPASAKESLSSITNIPCLRTANVQDSLELNDLLYVDRSYIKGNSDKLVRENDIIMSTANSRELVGKTSFVNSLTEEMTFGGFVMAIRSKINPKYLFYFLRLQFLNGKFMGNSTQTTNIANINSTSLGETETPIPPLEEQHRIVACIDSLFAKLDEAKEKAQKVVDGFETRKAAILHKAFSGELTAKWREENGVFLDEWEHLTLDDVADYKKGPFGSSITKAMFVPKAENTYKVYEQGNAIRKTLDYGSYYISKKKYEELKGFAIQPEDIIVSCAGTIGEIYKLPNNCEPGVINQALMRVRVYSNINEMYFIHYFTGVLKGDVIDEANGTAIKNIPPFKVLKAMNILLPSLFEQNEIVDILERMLSKEQQAKETAEAVIEQIDTMKKAILARAFRGELGTNDPTEASAIELIKQIIEEKIKIEESTPKRIQTKRKEVSFVAKTILEALKSSEKLTPEKLKVETALEIDDFYNQLKVLVDNGQIREIRIDGESYLEAVK